MRIKQPEFLTNDREKQVSVAKTMNGYLLHVSKRFPNSRMDIASAYFNPAGFKALEESLKGMSQVRLLLGAEPDGGPSIKPLQGRPTGRQKTSVAQRAAFNSHEKELEFDRNLLGFNVESDAAAQSLVDWLRSSNEEGEPKVEVRRLTTEFLHGKAFILDAEVFAAVFSGSSNFTGAGLFTNRELNLGAYQPDTVSQVEDWFEEVWVKAQPYDLAKLYAARWEPHSPEVIFGRMLWERYHTQLEEEKNDRRGSKLQLTKFQSDGAWRARRILEELHGVIIADEVGLGKTFLAGELIHDAVITRRQKVLIVAPATLRDSTWVPFLRDYNLAADVVSFNDLVNHVEGAGTTGSKLQNLDEYAMVVVDEAHGLRNASSERADAMRRLVEGQSPKDIVMLTATPVNNSLQDVYNLISYFVTNDAQFSDIGVPSLQQYFKRAMDMHPDDLSPEHLFDVLDKVAVRRTREFVKNHYRQDQVYVNGELQQISFPEPKVLRVDYNLDEAMPGLFDDVATALGANVDESAETSGVITVAPGEVLTMARYVPSRFRLGSLEEEQYEQQNAGLLRSALLKRFESSTVAYISTLNKLIASHDIFLDALDRGYVLTGQALRDWGSSDSDDLASFLETIDTTSGDATSTAEYDVESLRSFCEADRDLLQRMRDQVATLHSQSDPKVDALIEQLRRIVQLADEEAHTEEERRDKAKVLIFTYFADTANYLESELRKRMLVDDTLAPYADRLLLITGGDASSRAKEIANFAPKTAGSEDDIDLYDIAVATDVLAEGVNLQQARNIINYDLPWNPMRLVQRHGRIDRIGSPHDTIYLRCFFPDQHLDKMLGLEEKIQRKLKLASASFGASSGILPGIEGREGTFTETRDAIEELRRGDASLFGSSGGSAALSGEDYRRTLDTMLQDSVNKRKIEGLPWGSGSGYLRPGRGAGVVFCARIADHPIPWFRYIPLSPDNFQPVIQYSPAGQFEPVVISDTLASLAQADPGKNAERYLSDEMQSQLYSLWDLARADILQTWNDLSDSASSRPVVPKAMRDATNHVRQYGSDLGERQTEVTNRLYAPHSTRIQRAIRRILDADSTNAEKVTQLDELVTRNNLQPSRPADPKPPITDEDINLICWMTFEPGEV